MNNYKLKLKEALPITIVSKNINYLGKNLTKYMQDLYLINTKHCLWI